MPLLVVTRSRPVLAEVGIVTVRAVPVLVFTRIFCPLINTDCTVRKPVPVMVTSEPTTP